MIFNLENPVKVKQFGYVHQKCGAWHKGTVRESHLVIYCTDGEINMQILEDTYNLEPGDILLIPRNTFYRPLEAGGCKYYFFNFDAELLSENIGLPGCVDVFNHSWLVCGHAYTVIDSYFAASRLENFVKNAHYRIREIFEMADKLRPEKSFTDQLLLDNLMRELLIRMGSDKSPARSGKLTQILEYIQINYTEKINLSALSKKFSLSESYIARLFKKEMGLKPSEYVNKARILTSKTLLAETDLSVTDISEKVGFSDVYYFSKVFKKYTGLSPSDLRKRK